MATSAALNAMRGETYSVGIELAGEKDKISRKRECMQRQGLGDLRGLGAASASQAGSHKACHVKAQRHMHACQLGEVEHC